MSTGSSNCEHVVFIIFTIHIYLLNAIAYLNIWRLRCIFPNGMYFWKYTHIYICHSTQYTGTAKYQSNIYYFGIKVSARTVRQPSGCGAGREWSWRELQQSLHKRGGLCNGCGFVSLRNLGRAKHIQMCQTGTRPTQASSHIGLRTHKNEERGGENVRVHYRECRVMLSQKHERHAVVQANPVILIQHERGLLTVGLKGKPSLIHNLASSAPNSKENILVQQN